MDALRDVLVCVLVITLAALSIYAMHQHADPLIYKLRRMQREPLVPGQVFVIRPLDGTIHRKQCR